MLVKLYSVIYIYREVCDWLIIMLRGRRIFVFLIIVAVLAVSASAGVVVQPQTEEISHTQACSNINDSDSIHDDLLKSEFDLCYDNTLPEVSDDLTSEEDTPDYQPLTDGTNSLSLCLSALIGFGLFGSAKYIRTVSFGFIPDWYHDGGPIQKSDGDFVRCCPDTYPEYH